MNEPLVSIVIPVYNRADLILDTLISVKNQNYTNWECIIVDDRSTDDTLNIIENYINKDKRYKLFQNNNKKGAQSCRNIGLVYARGNYIIFLDSDDILFPHSLKERVNFLEERKENDFCVAAGIRGDFPFNSLKEYKLISTYRSKDVIKEFLNFSVPWGTLNPLYNRNSLLKKKISWDLQMKAFQDVDFHVNCVVSGLKFDYCNHEPDCLWRIHDSGNIGSKLKGNEFKFEQKYLILNKYINHPKLRSADFIPLYANLFRDIVYFNISHKKQEVIRLFNLLFFFKTHRDIIMIVFRIYRFFIINEVRIIPSFFYYILIILGFKRKFLSVPDNTHFIKEKYAQ